MKMTKKQYKLINDILNDISETIKNTQEKEYLLKKVDDSETGVMGFISKDFTFYYFDDAKHFYLSFIVGTSGFVSAYITKTICSVLEHDLFTVMQDSYWDSEKNTMAFGDEAIHVKYRDHLKNTGKTKCPICDRIVSNKEMLEVGNCLHCEPNKSKLIWN